jgi:hypothetical protein
MGRLFSRLALPPHRRLLLTTCFLTLLGLAFFWVFVFLRTDTRVLSLFGILLFIEAWFVTQNWASFIRSIVLGMIYAAALWIHPLSGPLITAASLLVAALSRRKMAAFGFAVVVALMGYVLMTVAYALVTLWFQWPEGLRYVHYSLLNAQRIGSLSAVFDWPVQRQGFGLLGVVPFSVTALIAIVAHTKRIVIEDRTQTYSFLVALAIVTGLLFPFVGLGKEFAIEPLFAVLCLALMMEPSLIARWPTTRHSVILIGTAFACTVLLQAFTIPTMDLTMVAIGVPILVVGLMIPIFMKKWSLGALSIALPSLAGTVIGQGLGYLVAIQAMLVLRKFMQ